jgi:hypothetical protein
MTDPQTPFEDELLRLFAREVELTDRRLHPSPGLLVDYVAGDVDSGDREIIASHCTTCVSCNRRLRGMYCSLAGTSQRLQCSSRVPTLDEFVAAEARGRGWSAAWSEWFRRQAVKPALLASSLAAAVTGLTLLLLSVPKLLRPVPEAAERGSARFGQFHTTYLLLALGLGLIAASAIAMFAAGRRSRRRH